MEIRKLQSRNHTEIRKLQRRNHMELIKYKSYGDYKTAEQKSYGDYKTWKRTSLKNIISSAWNAYVVLYNCPAKQRRAIPSR